MTNYPENGNHNEYLKTYDDLIEFIETGGWPFKYTTTVTQSNGSVCRPDIRVVKATCTTSSNYLLTFVCINGVISSVTDGTYTCTNVDLILFREGDLTVYWLSPYGEEKETEYPQWR